MAFKFASTWNGRALREKPVSYWGRIVFLILLGMLLARWLANFEWWRKASYSTYGMLLKVSQSAPTHPSWTAIVLIDDTDYWRGAWARRTPLKRTLLAELIRRIHEASPRVIALDVDLRAQVPDGSYRLHRDYASETTSVVSRMKSGVELFEVNASVLGSELPVHARA